MFNLIPAELAKHEKKFTLSDVKKGARMRDLDAALEWLKGAMTVNVCYAASGHGLFFFSDSDRECAENRMKVDFLLCKPTLTRQHNIIPVEVKSGRDYETVSLGKFRKKFRDQTQTAAVLHVKNLKVENGIVYLPLYMAPLLVTRPL